MADGKLNLGRVRPAYLGDYDPATAYKVMDRVSFNGHVYECIAETTAGIEPGKSQSAYWLPITVDSPAPEARWNGTKLYFEYPDGKTTEQVDLKGEPGKKGDDGSPATVEITSDYTSEDPNVAFSALGANRLYKVIQSGGVELSDAVDSDSSVTGASSKAVKLAYDKAVEAMESVPLPASATPRSAGTASVGASGRWAREDHVHPAANYQQSVSMSGSSAAIDYDSPNFILYSVSGATTINFQRKSNASVKYLYFWGSGTLTFSGVNHWGTADKKAPAYKSALILQVLFMWGEVTANVLYTNAA